MKTNRRNFLKTAAIGFGAAALLKPEIALAEETMGKKPMKLKPYAAKDFSRLLGMEGFSDTLLNNHFKLYQGYVNNTKLLLEKLAGLKDDGARKPEYAELKRRFGWEFNGMRLHELYFGNLGGDGVLKEKSCLYGAMVDNFGSYDAWKDDFVKTGKMRGIGWVALYYDKEFGRLMNVWINEHDAGHPAGLEPVLIMDVFEHAFITDYGLDKGSYIGSFFKNINWDTAEKRIACT